MNVLAALILLTAGHVSAYHHCPPRQCGSTVQSPGPDVPAWRHCYSTLFGKRCDLYFTEQAGEYAHLWEYAGAYAYIADKSVECDLVGRYPGLSGQSREWDGQECYAGQVAEGGGL